MKKLLFHSLLQAVLFSCSNDDSNQVVYQEVKFELGSTNQAGRISTEIEPNRILISLEDSEGTEILSDESILLTSFGNSYVSASIELPIGDFRLTSFIVIDEFDQAIYVTPMEGSAKAYLVTNPLPIEFSVTEEEITTVTPEVLSLFEEVDPDPSEYGYGVFSFNVVDIFTIETAAILDSDSSYISTSISVTGYDTNDEIILETVVNTESEASTPLDLLSGLEYYTFEVNETGYHSLSYSYQTTDLKNLSDFPIFLSSTTETIAIEVSDVFTGSSDQSVFIYFSTDGCKKNVRIDFGGIETSDFQFIESLHSTLDEESNRLTDVYYSTSDLGSYIWGSSQNPEDLCESYPVEDLQIFKSVAFEYGYRRLGFYTAWNVETGLWTAEQVVLNSLDHNEVLFHEVYNLND